MSYAQQIGHVAAMGAIGRIGDALTNVKAINPFDVTDAEAATLSASDQAILTNMGNEAFQLSSDGQGALLGLSVATPGGGALFKRKVVTALLLGAVVGGAAGWYFGKRRK
jgi:hypothetical protein